MPPARPPRTMVPATSRFCPPSLSAVSLGLEIWCARCQQSSAVPAVPQHSFNCFPLWRLLKLYEFWHAPFSGQLFLIRLFLCPAGSLVLPWCWLAEGGQDLLNKQVIAQWCHDLSWWKEPGMNWGACPLQACCSLLAFYTCLQANYVVSRLTCCIVALAHASEEVAEVANFWKSASHASSVYRVFLECWYTAILMGQQDCWSSVATKVYLVVMLFHRASQICCFHCMFLLRSLVISPDDRLVILCATYQLNYIELLSSMGHWVQCNIVGR